MTRPYVLSQDRPIPDHDFEFLVGDRYSDGARNMWAALFAHIYVKPCDCGSPMGCSYCDRCQSCCTCPMRTVRSPRPEWVDRAMPLGEVNQFRVRAPLSCWRGSDV